MRDRIISGVFALGMAIFAFTDLWISQSFATFDNPFGLFFEEFGEYPGYVLIFFSLFIILRYSEKMWIRILIVVLLPVLILALYFRYSDLDWMELSILIFLSVLVLIPFTQLRMSRKEWVEVANKVMTMALIVPLAIVQILKLLWGRVRFRDLGGDFAKFTPWYIPQGYTNNFSFPSGHTAMGIFLVSMNFYFKNKAIFWITMFWAVMTSISRLLIGAHYASDIWFSFFTGLLIYDKLASSNSSRSLNQNTPVKSIAN